MCRGNAARLITDASLPDQLTFDHPAPPITGDTPLVPARMVNEFVRCLRLAYLMWTQSE